jgi:hypothetical protein
MVAQISSLIVMQIERKSCGLDSPKHFVIRYSGISHADDFVESDKTIMIQIGCGSRRLGSSFFASLIERTGFLSDYITTGGANRPADHCAKRAIMRRHSSSNRCPGGASDYCALLAGRAGRAAAS